MYIVVCPVVFFLWPLCCLSFDMRLLIARLVYWDDFVNKR